MRAVAITLGLIAPFFFIGQLIGHPALAATPGLIKVSPAQMKSLGIGVSPLERHAGSLSPGMPALVVVPDGQTRVIAAPLAGAVLDAPFAEGEPVRKGQVLVRLSSPELINLQRDLAMAATSQKLAQDAARRDAALFKEGIVAESRALASAGQLAQARAALGAQRAALTAQGLGAAAIAEAERGERFAAEISLSAPFDGVVLMRQAQAGSRVETAAPLYTIARLNPLWLEIEAPADVAARLKPGMQVDIPGHKATGSVLRVAPTASAAQTVRVRAKVNNPEGDLRVGQSVAARILAAGDGSAWRVPVNAMVREAGKTWVFVLRQGGFIALPVTLHNQSAGAAAVTGDFKAGEMVAVSGVAALKAWWTGGGESGNAQ